MIDQHIDILSQDYEHQVEPTSSTSDVMSVCTIYLIYLWENILDLEYLQIISDYRDDLMSDQQLNYDDELIAVNPIRSRSIYKCMMVLDHRHIR